VNLKSILNKKQNKKPSQNTKNKTGDLFSISNEDKSFKNNLVSDLNLNNF
jgi:hypothetical protein